MAFSILCHCLGPTGQSETRYNSPDLSCALADTRYDDDCGRTVRLAMDVKF